MTKFLGGDDWSDPVHLAPPSAAHTLDLTIQTDWAIAAGPEGVHVATYWCHPEVVLWSSRNGVGFTSRTVPLTDNALGDTRLAAVPTGIGTAYVTAVTGRVLRLAAGARIPVTLVDQLPDNAIVEFIAVSGEQLVVHTKLHERLKEGEPGFVPGDDDLSENDTYYSATWCARLDTDALTLRKRTVDPGRLPDAGVDELYLPDALVPYGSGFLMSGQTLTRVGGIYGVGGLWISEEGCDWTQEKVRGDGFDKVDSLIGIASSGPVTVLVGQEPFEKVELARIWAGRQ
ncbi:hypothetical protein [Catellatospora coxensis]|uniref:hypothetical protein n=1 Tax=Catellatospora coxensis TaxID=310354 RepID=UPI001940EB47|nr:hypothetical protein [Catellatospora coxensis]